MNTRLIYKSLVVALCVALLHLGASQFYWYMTIAWSDSVVHASAGGLIAILYGALYFRYLKTYPDRELIVSVLLCVFCIGLCWEVYEFSLESFFQIQGIADPYDTAVDMGANLIGALIGSIFVIREKNRYTQKYEK